MPNIQRTTNFWKKRVGVFFPFHFFLNFLLSHSVLGMQCSIPVVVCRIYICFHHSWGSLSAQLQLLGEYFSCFFSGEMFINMYYSFNFFFQDWSYRFLPLTVILTVLTALAKSVLWEWNFCSDLQSYAA